MPAKSYMDVVRRVGCLLLRAVQLYSTSSAVCNLIRIFIVRMNTLCIIGSQKMLPVKYLIRLRESGGWFVAWLGAYLRRYVFSRWGSYKVTVVIRCLLVYILQLYEETWREDPSHILTPLLSSLFTLSRQCLNFYGRKIYIRMWHSRLFRSLRIIWATAREMYFLTYAPNGDSNIYAHPRLIVLLDCAG